MSRKIEAITSRALERVVAGTGPEDAWLETLRELYPEEMLASQVKHSCPKWAFCILCHRGFVKGARPGCCPAAEGKSTAAYTLRAFDLVRTDRSLAANKMELKRQVFGEPGSSEFRTPNDEVEVLLSLWDANAIEEHVDGQ